MRLFIPPLGTQLKLVSDWEFKLVAEYRNWAMRCSLLGKKPSDYYASSVDELPLFCRLPAGTVLSVDRIYIRQGLSDFDSVSFRVFDTPDPRLRGTKAGGMFTGKGKPRFWASLRDVNKLDVEALEP